MENIKIEKYDTSDLDTLGVTSWPVWEKGVSRFDWVYDDKETCYILEGKAVVETPSGDKVEFAAGDKVIFPAGLECTWDITVPIKKYYNFG